MDPGGVDAAVLCPALQLRYGGVDAGCVVEPQSIDEDGSHGPKDRSRCALCPAIRDVHGLGEIWDEAQLDSQRGGVPVCLQVLCQCLDLGIKWTYKVENAESIQNMTGRGGGHTVLR